jgi:hypothetical protein
LEFDAAVVVAVVVVENKFRQEIYFAFTKQAI